ncbi:hypothetical protein [Streptomyces sp. NPDC048202]|uniref:hypothetical protein n=1 Tax=Streptomyces sp. NPDC048202 TaxID=3365514 RepID=UPI00372322E3
MGTADRRRHRGEGLLFFHRPLPIDVALGWLTARDRISLVHHDLRLAQGTAPPSAAGSS